MKRLEKLNPKNKYRMLLLNLETVDMKQVVMQFDGLTEPEKEDLALRLYAKETAKTIEDAMADADPDVKQINVFLTNQQYLKDDLRQKSFRSLEYETITFYLLAQYGDLSSGMLSEERRSYINNEIMGHRFGCLNFIQDGHWEKEFKKIEHIKNAYLEGVPIRIWMSEDAEDKVAYLFLMSELAKVDGCGKLVELNYNRAYQAVRGTDITADYLEYDDVLNLFKHEQFITRGMLDYSSECYSDLCKNSGNLRIVLNGNVIGVTTDYFDSIIKRFIPNKKFSVHEAIGEVLVSRSVPEGYSFISYRLANLLNADEYKMVRGVMNDGYYDTLATEFRRK